MSEAVVDDIVAVLPPLLQSLEALSFITRHLNPPDFGRVMQTVGAPEQELQAARSRLGEWPDNFADVRDAIPFPRAAKYPPRGANNLINAFAVRPGSPYPDDGQVRGHRAVSRLGGACISSACAPPIHRSARCGGSTSSWRGVQQW